MAFMLSQAGVFLTAILDREAFTELHLSFRRSMTMMKPMLAASMLQQTRYHSNKVFNHDLQARLLLCAVPLLKECEGTWVCWSDR